jgi:hypothetical protein
MPGELGQPILSAAGRPAIPIQHIVYHPTVRTARGIMRSAAGLIGTLMLNALALEVFDFYALKTEENGDLAIDPTALVWFPVIVCLMLFADSIALLVFLDSFGNFRIMKRAMALLPFVVTHRETLQTQWTL